MTTPTDSDDPRNLWQLADALAEESAGTRERAVRAALVACDWRLRPAAARLGIAVSTLQRTLQRMPSVQEELAQRGHRAGRPPRVPGA